VLNPVFTLHSTLCLFHSTSFTTTWVSAPLSASPPPQSKHPQFSLYRYTKFVTYTVTSVFAMGYAFSAVLAPLRVADSRVPKPWRKADRDRTGERARYPGDARRVATDAEGWFNRPRPKGGFR
jgi:hypothetical protein